MPIRVEPQYHGEIFELTQALMDFLAAKGPLKTGHVISALFNVAVSGAISRGLTRDDLLDALAQIYEGQLAIDALQRGAPDAKA
jgi:hypothetical protein